MICQYFYNLNYITIKKVVIFEVEGGNDKWLDGHRKDTLPIANALQDANIETKVLFYRDEWAEELFEACKDFDGYISQSRFSMVNMRNNTKISNIF